MTIFLIILALVGIIVLYLIFKNKKSKSETKQIGRIMSEEEVNNWFSQQAGQENIIISPSQNEIKELKEKRELMKKNLTTLLKAHRYGGKEAVKNQASKIIE